ncbi:hypothetical protein GTH44_34280 [Bradyrhizobium japonicum]|nr:hypothetical protein [Bradyrhizobium japonicum]
MISLWTQCREPPNTAVIPREGGESSTPRPLRIPLPSLEYWIARPRAQLRTRRTMIPSVWRYRAP